MDFNYETDPLKHYVRKHGWLTAARQQKRVIKNRSKRIPLRYFTFCASEAIDVFMLEREGILERSEDTGRLEGVYFCEMDLNNFGIIADLIGSPEQGFQGEFEKIVLFEDDEKTAGKSLEDEDFYPLEIRRKLRYKDAHHRLRGSFPFDIINLDVCGVMFPPRKGIITPLLKSIIQILKWQRESQFPINGKECNQFTLFLTSHIDRDDTDQNAIEQLENLVIENICTNHDFQSAFVRQYGNDQVQEFARKNFAEFFCVALPKFMIQKALLHLGWKVTCGPTYLYNRDYKREENKQYQIMHTVSVYERIPNFHERLDAISTDQYDRSVVQILNDRIKWLDDVIENFDINRELEEDLKHIVELRNQHHSLNSFNNLV